MKKVQPTLRFPEFSGDWVTKTLKEVATIGRGKSKHRPRDADFLFGGKYPFIQTGDIRNANLYLTEYSQTYSDAGLKQSKLWDEDTLCITIAANIAETAILKIKACFPDSIIGLIPYESETTVLFVKHLFDKFKLEIQSLSQGVAQANLNQEKLSNIEFNFPTLQEQTKIANFLSAVDQKMHLLQQQKELLETYKKGVMQKIFNQELRFTQNNGSHFQDWEEKSLGEISSKESSNISANKIEENDGDYIIYGASGVLKKVDFYLQEDDYVSIVKDGAGAGRIFYCKGKTSVLGTMEMIKPSTNINTYFLYSLLGCIDFTQFITGSTIPHIYYKDYSKIKFGVPSLEEQTKIAEFLSAIDHKISLVNQQLAHTQTYKKGLLQQLFV